MDKNIIIELYKRQYKVICLYLIKYGCSASDAEDIVHDSFIKAIEYMDSVDVKSLSSWLFKVALNNYKNRVKRSKIIRSISIDQDNFCEHLIDEFTIEGEMLIKEKKYEVKEIISKLKEEYQSLLILKYDMELSYKEISLLLGINEDTVKTYLYRARNKFKEEWRERNG